MAGFDDTPTASVNSRLAAGRDDIHPAAYSDRISQDMMNRPIELIALNVDFESRLKPTDRIKVLFSQRGKNDQVPDGS